jgi:CHAT domain
MPQTTILILAANPKGTTTLRLDQEVRDITEGLQRATQRATFNLQSRWATRPRDVQRALLDLNPQIVHFSGHGIGEPTTDSNGPSRKLDFVDAQSAAPEGLAFEDPNGNTSLVSTVALASLFALFQASVQCVVLNACYSANQADAIAEHIPYVIGMNQAIGDKAAIEFAVSFYDAIGAGRDVPFAFELAKNAIQLAGIPEHLTPVLRSNPTSQPPAPAKPPGTPATPQLTPGQQRRLEQQRSSLQAEWELRSEKLQRLRQSRSVEAATAVQFQLDQQIETEAAKLQELEQELDRLESQI